MTYGPQEECPPLNVWHFEPQPVYFYDRRDQRDYAYACLGDGPRIGAGNDRILWRDISSPLDWTT